MAEVKSVADWDLIRTEYVTTGCTLKMLAEKHGLTTRALEKRSSKEGWIRQRDEYQRGIAQSMLEASTTAAKAAAAETAAARYSTQDKVRQTAEALADLIRSTMAMADGVMLPKDIRSLTGALKDINEICSSGSAEGAQGIEIRIAGLEESWLQ